jgi:hypothetical protein
MAKIYHIAKGMCFGNHRRRAIASTLVHAFEEFAQFHLYTLLREV